MKNRNDMVIIDLDRPRELRYGHKALKTLSAMTGKSLEELEEGDIDFEQIETFLYCGLLSDARANNETLKLEQMEDLLDEAPSFVNIVEKMQEAFAKAFGSMTEGNVPVPAIAAPPAQPAQPNRKQRRTTGKKA